ncbi:GntR family transcriptional regulator [Thalassotalea ganghwensis]
MEIVIDIEDETPMFAQLVEQVKQAVAAGNLLPGAQLPSIRQLANDLDLNSKTVAKAYKLLERDAIIEAKGYRGSFIHPNAKENCTVDFEALATNKLTNVINELEQAGVTSSEIRIVFNRLMSGKK